MKTIRPPVSGAVNNCLTVSPTGAMKRYRLHKP